MLPILGQCLHRACALWMRHSNSKVITHEYKGHVHTLALASTACSCHLVQLECYWSVSLNAKKRTEKFTLFSDHNRSLPKLQPGAMTTGHSPKGNEKDLELRWIRPVLSGNVCLLCHQYSARRQNLWNVQSAHAICQGFAGRSLLYTNLC